MIILDMLKFIKLNSKYKKLNDIQIEWLWDLFLKSNNYNKLNPTLNLINDFDNWIDKSIENKNIII